nr:glycoside hydrolase family 66 protein [Segatella albensis]
MASPDYMGGAPQEINFRQDGNYVLTTAPNLKYWTMIVIEK